MRQLIRLSHWWGGGSAFGEREWTVGVPVDVDELAAEADLRHYVREHVLKHFPIESGSPAPKGQGDASGGAFWFVENVALRERLAADWHEAQDVCHVLGWKSCVILCGGILEALLADALERAEAPAARRRLLLVLVPLADLDDPPVGVGDPDRAPPGDEGVEVHRALRHLRLRAHLPELLLHAVERDRDVRARLLGTRRGGRDQRRRRGRGRAPRALEQPPEDLVGEEDALRRDFSVNALFYSIEDFSIIDYAGGMEDLKAGVIRTIGDPWVRITEDPVRMLRAVRFAAMLGFSVEPATWDALLAQSNAITMASPPRLYEEVLKLLLLGEGEKSYQLLRRTGLFAALFATFSKWLDRETDGFPHTRVGQALDWVDRRVQQGGKVTPQLLFAVMFGQYLEEKAEGLREGGAHLQQAVDQAVAEFLENLSPTVQVHGKVGGLIRHILGYQHRFRKTPGRHPASFVKRPAFGDALEYLCFAGELTQEDREACGWWREYVRKNPLAPAAETSGAETAEPQVKGKRKRPRRRRRKRGDA